jgi:lysophospholipase L1-like esterase
MHFYKSIRFLRQLRVPALVCLITLSLFVIAELGVRYFAPQVEQRVAWNGVPGTRPDDELSHVLTPNYRAVMHSPEFDPPLVEYRTNAQGLRDDRIYNKEKSPGTTRILIVGDSFAQGVATNYAEIWPVVFEKELAKLGYNVDVIKAGVFSYDTRDEIIYLKRLFQNYRPDIVVLAFLLNDLFTNVPLTAHASASSTTLQVAEQGRGALTAQKVDNLHLLTLAKRLLLKSDVLYTKIYLKSQRGAYFDPQSAALRRQLDITKQLLLEGSTYAATNGSKLVVLSIPQGFQVINTDKSIDVSLVDKELEQVANEAHFSWLSSLPVFLAAYARDQTDLHYRLDGHLNVKGNRLLGDFLAAKFAENLGSEMGKTDDRVTNVK